MPATLQRPTLVLNRNWQPIRVSTVARSLILVWNDHARIVDPADFQTYDWSDWTAMAPDEGELFIQAVTYRLRVPEVVALTRYDRVPLGKVAFNRRNLFKRDHEMCQYCGSQPGLDSLTIDHIVPRSRGGTGCGELGGGQGNPERHELAISDINIAGAIRLPADVAHGESPAEEGM